jgi:hypothetical protein
LIFSQGYVNFGPFANLVKILSEAFFLRMSADRFAILETPRAESSSMTVTHSAGRNRLVALSLVLFSILIYLNSAGNGFVLDDKPIIQDNPLIRTLQNVPILFVSDYWGHLTPSGLYRPLVMVSYAVDHFVGGLNPAGYHLGNIALHALNSLLVLLLFRRLTGDELTAAAGAFFFAAHAVHTEAVANIVGRAELMSATFFLTSLLFYLSSQREEVTNSRSLYLASLAAYLLALLSKENAITLVGVIFLYDVTYGEERQDSFLRRLGRIGFGRFGRVYAGYLLVAVAYFAVRSLVIDLGAAHNPENPLLKLGPPWRILNALQIALHSLWVLFFPVDLSYSYSDNQIPLLTHLLEPRTLLVLVLSIFTLWLVMLSFRKSKVLFFAMMFAIFTFSIYSAVYVTAGSVLAERFLYTPSIGFCLAISVALSGFCSRLRPATTGLGIFVVVMVVAIGLNGWRTILRNPNWRTDTGLFLHDHKVTSGSAMIHYNVGVVLMNERGQYEDALREFKKALRIRPDYPIARTSIGHVLIKLGREKEAIAVYEQLVEKGKADKRVFNNLGFLLVDRNIDVERGIYYLEEIAKKHPRNPSILDSLGWAYFKVGRLREGYDLIRRSLELNDSGESGRERKKHLREVERALKAERPREDPPKPVKPLDF